MEVSTRTPEGEPNKCPVCGHAICVEPSRPPGDAPCPYCGTLLWFTAEPTPRFVNAWEYGAELLKRREIESGLAVLQSVVTYQPNDLAHRQSLRQIERSIRTEHKVRAETASLVMSEVWWEIRQTKRKHASEVIEWGEIDRAVERGLAIAPWDVELNLELGDASRARGFWEIARFAYNCALEAAPDRADIKATLESLSKQGD